MKPVSLGAFTVETRIARGGMGEVWAGTHSTGVPVAIKFVRANLDASDWKELFEREVAAQARLDHPGVVYLFDRGRLDGASARRLGVHPGSPWLAMERCSSNLGAVASELTWADFQSVMEQLLEALAHAHSCGVLHRDIKIANVLISTPTDTRPGVKLADFGIAHALAGDDEQTRSVGTPRYSSPEQIAGHWEAMGPWTDLYALGVLAWRLLTGKRPWERLKGVALLQAMAHRPLGWPGTRFACPAGVEAWVARLTDKRPSRRFQLAADALEALHRLSDSGPGWDTWEDVQETIPNARRPVFQPEEDPPGATETSIRMNRVGLGLVDMRRPELIGRRVERRILWDMLRTVANLGDPRTVAVTGPPRVGRTRFQEWLTEAAERTGQATAVSVLAVPGKRLADQMVLALRAYFRIGARTAPQARAHLVSWLGEPIWLDRLVDELRSGVAEDGRFELSAKAVASLASRRPVVVTVRGAAGDSTLPALWEAIQAEGPCAVLLLTDTRIGGHQVLELEPLGAHSATRLADALVVLEPASRSGLVRRAEGSPGFIVGMLGFWVKSGWLEGTAHGFRFVGDPAALPAGMALVAASRVEALRTRVSAEAWRSLESAAVIGHEVDRGMWAKVDGSERVAARVELETFLLADGLASATSSGWRFSSVPLRERVIAGAADVSSIHVRCAQLLSVATDPVRVGAHWLAAGEARRSLKPMRDGLRNMLVRQGGEAALGWLPHLEAAIETPGIPEPQHWRAVRSALRAGIRTDIGDLERAEADADEALSLAETLGDRDLAGRAWARKGAVEAQRGRWRDRQHAYRKALDLGVGVPTELRSLWWVELAKAHLGMGDRDSWTDCMSAAGHCADEDPDGDGPFWISMARAAAAQSNGDVRSALDHLSHAYGAASNGGNDRGRLSALRSRAHTLLTAGRLLESRMAFQSALELACAVRPSRAPVVLANSVALDLALGNRALAAARFERHRFLLPAGHDGARDRLPAHCAGLALASLDGDWRRVRYFCDRVVRYDAWSWAEVWCNLRLSREAVTALMADGRRDLAHRVARCALEASRRNGPPEERDALSRALEAVTG